MRGCFFCHHVTKYGYTLESLICSCYGRDVSCVHNGADVGIYTIQNCFQVVFSMLKTISILLRNHLVAHRYVRHYRYLLPNP